jgi:hypothetical protein
MLNKLAPTVWGQPEGDRIVRLVYMDEAGISRDEPHLVVSAVIVDADKKLIEIERHIEKLVNRFIPEESRDGFVFQAKHLFNGGGKVFKRNDAKWPLSRRLEIADSLAKIAKKFSLPLALGSVEKAKFLQDRPEPIEWKTEADKALGAHIVAFMSAAMQVEIWMRQNTNNEVCLLVIENIETAKTLITETQATYQNPDAFRRLYPDGKIPEPERQFFPFRRIKQRPLFEPKAPSSILQIADFYAYVFKKLLEEDRRYLHFAGSILPCVAVREIEKPKASKSV